MTVLTLVAARRTGDVRHLSFAAAGAAVLQSFTPGSHVIVQAGDVANAYSLTGDNLDPPTYEISVLATPDGTGSAWLHGQLEVGDRLEVSAPHSAFAPMSRARHHLLIAGGIGVTPMLSHLRAARRHGRSCEVVYAHRPGHAAHLDDLSRLAGDRLTVARGRDELLSLLTHRLARQPLGTVMYLCGPGPMMSAVETLAGELGWSGERILTEAFGAGSLDPGDPFTATLISSGRRVEVAAGVSLLEALEAEGVGVPNLCRQGVCGECRIAVTGGRPRHRDLYLTDEERAAGDCVMACVSRADGEHLELAL